jgi:hypothetical protein
LELKKEYPRAMSAQTGKGYLIIRDLDFILDKHKYYYVPNH